MFYELWRIQNIIKEYAVPEPWNQWNVPEPSVESDIQSLFLKPTTYF